MNTQPDGIQQCIQADAALQRESTRVLGPQKPAQMLSYTIDDPIEVPLTCSVDVTVEFSSGKRWLFFVTPDLLGRVGDVIEGTQSRLHLGERHMIVVSDISPTIIGSVLQQLADSGELENRTLPLADGPNNSFKLDTDQGGA